MKESLHIHPLPGTEIAKVVLMPGDPLRAKWIAETFLKDAVLVNETRGMLAFTGTSPTGKKITVMASGMGMASIGIYSHELYETFGVEAIIRIGTCGSYQLDVDLRDVIVASASSTDSNFLVQMHLPGFYSAVGNFELMEASVNELRKAKIPFHVGNVLSADIFYDQDKEVYKKWQSLGVLAVEMESYALYVNAAIFHKKALCLLTVTDHFEKSGKLTAEERQTGLELMVSTAIKVAEKFA